jgi:hypothetical protein
VASALFSCFFLLLSFSAIFAALNEVFASCCLLFVARIRGQNSFKYC